MANPEHVKILKQGVEAWNEWRRVNHEITPDLRGADLHGLELSNSNLSDANLSDTNLQEANLSDANLCRAWIDRADCFWIGLQFADLRHAIIQGSNLVGAYLNFADLRSASIIDCNLSSARLEGTNFEEAEFSFTIFGDNDLSVANGLEKAVHSGPSIIGTHTLYRSNKYIPINFLRGAGVPENLIEYLPSLVNQLVHFYSCFISYSSKNHDFAERLYADLQNKGVRCWFAPKDLRIGDKFRQRIDESIRVHDKVLLILSGQSILSPWVEEEVESAFEREHRENRLVLFPVRIDDAVMNSSQAWAASLRRMRHIGDFSKWKDHDSYQKAFTRLMRDLKAGSSTSTP
ncbi:MAG: toll/interleukin-1 receptor domain-containing protein [Blastocatellia bacterium]